MTMANYRKSRRAMNARLLRAKKAGRLEEELRKIEQETRAWWEKRPAGSKARRKAR